MSHKNSNRVYVNIDETIQHLCTHPNQVSDLFIKQKEDEQGRN